MQAWSNVFQESVYVLSQYIQYYPLLIHLKKKFVSHRHDLMFFWSRDLSFSLEGEMAKGMSLWIRWLMPMFWLDGQGLERNKIGKIGDEEI